MANIVPFRGLRYNPRRIRDLSKVLCPPYDIITEAEQKRFYRISPHNMIRLELGKIFSSDNGSENRYTRAKAFLEKWISEGILLQDREPSIYFYEQQFGKGKRRARRIGFMALLELGKTGGRFVYPHEKTFPLPKEDRFLLLEKLHTNVSPLFFLFTDPEKRVEAVVKPWMRRTAPAADVSLDGVRHRMWRLADRTLIAHLRKQICRSALFIADGHHRFEVSRVFQKKMGKKLGNFVLVYFANLMDADSAIFPIHRLVKGLGYSFAELQAKLAELFTFTPYPSASRLLKAMEKPRREYVFGMHWKGKPFYLLTLKNRKALAEIDRRCRRSKTWRRLDVTILHELVFKNRLGITEETLRRRVLFIRDVGQCLEHIRRGRYQVIFFLRGARMDQVRRIALAKERVPQKSTYFYPKPVTGLVLHRFEEGATH
ncbi:MAG: DUF1015 domain-containing protein [Candidatus Omnitrophota bacterium]